MTIQALYTLATGPGGTGAQTHPSASLGPFASTTEWTGGVTFDLFGLASSSDVSTNRNDYRCLWLLNPDPTTRTAVRVFINPVTAGGIMAVGVDPRPISRIDSLAPQTVETVSGYLAPASVTFTAPNNYTSGIVVGDLPENFGKAIWLRRTPTASPSAAAESCTVTVQHSTGVVWTRTVVWQTELAGTVTTPPAPLAPYVFPPTPSPFLRTSADFMSTGGSRILWEIDATLQDVGPYDYQLQTSPSGVSNATDWVDVGPPVRDAIYLIDPNARLWGMSSIQHYRVILTTGSSVYVSPSCNVYNGVLNHRDWLNVREITRKEHLHQREFVGQTGFLLKAKRYGTRCSCKNPTTGERGNSSCTICYGIGIVGGFHPPVPMIFATLDDEQSVTEKSQYNENLGTTRPVVIKGRVLSTIPCVHEDVWLSASGDDLRYSVWSVSEIAAIAGASVVYSVELRLRGFSDIIYRFPVVRPPNVELAWNTETTLDL